MKKSLYLCLCAFFAMSVIHCKKKSDERAEPKAVVADSAESLSVFFKDLQTAIRTGNDVVAKKLARSLIPNQVEIATVLKDDRKDRANDIVKYHELVFPKDDAKLVEIFTTDAIRNVIKVHASTTEELGLAKEGTPAYIEFPSGVLKIARKALVKERTFYEVELLESNKEQGLKFHMFFYTPSGWRILGPLWRVKPSLSLPKRDEQKTFPETK